MAFGDHKAQRASLVVTRDTFGDVFDLP
ncbi:uncharacterized protein G2W53_041185 [Senna tora]|uniref:Uncharacterized protein n=1 Tax=Senna tora TaxID=362788 RepID=A0A834SES6_9FABA|nr:uncharacterized protein G2W53_041185 [Senna tora]